MLVSLQFSLYNKHARHTQPYSYIATVTCSTTTYTVALKHTYTQITAVYENRREPQILAYGTHRKRERKRKTTTKRMMTHKTIGNRKEKTMKIAYALVCCVWYNFIAVK